MINSADPDQLASSEANWSGSTLFAKTGYVVFSKRRVKLLDEWQTVQILIRCHILQQVIWVYTDFSTIPGSVIYWQDVKQCRPQLWAPGKACFSTETNLIELPSLKVHQLNISGLHVFYRVSIYTSTSLHKNLGPCLAHSVLSKDQAILWKLILGYITWRSPWNLWAWNIA